MNDEKGRWEKGRWGNVHKQHIWALSSLPQYSMGSWHMCFTCMHTDSWMLTEHTKKETEATYAESLQQHSNILFTQQEIFYFPLLNTGDGFNVALYGSIEKFEIRVLYGKYIFESMFCIYTSNLLRHCYGQKKEYQTDRGDSLQQYSVACHNAVAWACLRWGNRLSLLQFVIWFNYFIGQHRTPNTLNKCLH